MNTAIPEITSEITLENTSETSSSKHAGKKEDEKDAFQFFEQNGFGKIGNYYHGRIKSWCTELSSELVVEAMKLALENGSHRWNYVEAVLKDWCSNGCQTINEIQDARNVFQRQKQQQVYRKPVRKEYIPEWLQEDHQPDKPIFGLDFEAKKRLFEKRLRAYC